MSSWFSIIGIILLYIKLKNMIFVLWLIHCTLWKSMLFCLVVHIHVLIFNFMCKIDITKREGVFVSFDLTSETVTPENPPPEKVRTSESTGKAARGLHTPSLTSEAKGSMQPMSGPHGRSHTVSVHVADDVSATSANLVNRGVTRVCHVADKSAWLWHVAVTWLLRQHLGPITSRHVARRGPMTMWHVASIFKKKNFKVTINY